MENEGAEYSGIDINIVELYRTLRCWLLVSGLTVADVDIDINIEELYRTLRCWLLVSGVTGGGRFMAQCWDHLQPPAGWSPVSWPVLPPSSSSWSTSILSSLNYTP